MMKCVYCASFVALAAVIGCSGSNSDPAQPSTGTGGTTTLGGSSSAPASSTTGGASAIGSATSTTDVRAAGGTSTTGGATNAATTALTSTGGAASSNSVAANGGANSVGGAVAIGGTKATDPASSTGGTKNVAGSTSLGGAAGKTSATSASVGGTATTTTSGATTGGNTGASGATATAGASGGGTTTPNVKKFIGNTSPKNKDIPADFATFWQEVSMDANSKWGFVQPDSADKWVWEPVDKVHQYAKDNGIIFKQHNFFWKIEQPAWVNDSNIMTVGPKWVETFCTRYPDVPMIDVVNEPLTNHNPPPYTKGMGGTGTTGYDWVITAFKWARQYCPNSILIINEYNIIEWDDDHNAFMAMMEKLLAAGAQIDAIGAQGHDVYKTGAAKSKTYLDKLATLNLPIYITEFEVDQADDAKQLTYMQEAITMFYDHPSVKGISHWGYVKGMMWNQRPNGWLVDTNGKQRPAMTWLQEFIKSKE